MNPLPEWFNGVFIATTVVVFAGVKGPKSHILLIALVRGKYLLHNINEREI